MIEYNNLLYEDNTFKICTGSKNKDIEILDFHPNTKEIGNYAFSGCINIKEVILPEGIKKNRERCFFI